MIGVLRQQDASAGLNFKSGIVVVFEFRAEGQLETIFHHLDFVLHEGAKELVSAFRRNESEVVCSVPAIPTLIARVAISEPAADKL